MVTIHCEAVPAKQADRGAWLKLSEEALTKTWDNPDDDAFNELLQK